MSNNLTKTALDSKSQTLKTHLKAGLLCGLSLMVLASCAPADLNGSKKASAEKRGSNGTVRPNSDKPSQGNGQVTVQGPVAPLTESSLGFFETTDSGLPEAVRNSKSSLVKLIIPKANLQSNKDILKSLTNSTEEQDISNDDLITKLREEIERTQEQGKKDELLGLLVQVEQCKQKNDNACKIMKDISIQSGIAVRDNQNIITTLESIAEYVKNKHDLTTDEKIKDSVNVRTLLQSTEIPMIIINAEGKIFSGSENKITVGLDANLLVSDRVMYKIKNDSRYKAFHNTIALRTDKPLEVSMIKSGGNTVSLQSTDELFVIGFPHESKSRERNNANGKNVFISKGKLAQAQSVKSALGLNIQIEQADEGNFLGLSNDSNLGLQGAAIVNKDGELIGIAAYSKAEGTDLQGRSTLGITKSNAVAGFLATGQLRQREQEREQ